MGMVHVIQVLDTVGVADSGTPPSVAGPRCGACIMCCITTDVPELAKPSWTLCQHCTGTGCGVYASRPASCRAFECGWYREPRLPDELRPDRSGVMVEILDGTDVVLAVVDRQRPEAWQAPLVTRWLRYLVDAGHPVIVTTGPGSQLKYLIRGQQDVAEINRVMLGFVNEEKRKWPKEV